MNSLVPRLLGGATASIAILATAAALAVGCTSDAPAPSATAAPTPAATADRADRATAQPIRRGDPGTSADRGTPQPTPSATPASADRGTAQPTSTATPASAGGGAATPTATPTQAAVRAPEPDRAALVVLYETTGGQSWIASNVPPRNWLSDKPIGEWPGVTTDDAGRVTELFLPFSLLHGEIPAELGSLTHLKSFQGGNRGSNPLGGTNVHKGFSPPSSVWVAQVGPFWGHSGANHPIKWSSASAAGPCCPVSMCP